MDIQEAEECQKIVISQFSKYGNRGKPIATLGEWTHLAGIVARKENGHKQCVSLATGTKCLGPSAVSNLGYSVNDSHAEVLARRAFISFMYSEILGIISNCASEWIENEGGNSSASFVLKPDVSLHLYCSHTPCGDGSIIPQEAGSSDSCDIFRTGAKCTELGPQDPLLPGTGYHITGAFRIKPGRGERTLSMSCSDKFAKWTVMGIQGSLLMSFFRKPLYLNSIIFSRCPFSQTAIRRAVYKRNRLFSGTCDLYSFHQPDIVYISSKCDSVELQQQEKSSSPSPLAIVWHGGMERSEVLVSGYRQGVSSSKQHLPHARSSVCPRVFCDNYVNVQQQLNQPVDNDSTYRSLKLAASPEYQKVWSNLRNHYKYWVNDVRKSEAQSFLV